MELLYYLLLFGPLTSTLLISLITINHHKFTQWIAVISSLFTGLFASYLALSVLVTAVDPNFFTFMTIYQSASNNLILSFQLDSLSRFMAFIASFLGMLIVLFSVEYMKDDKALGRYYFFIQLFILSMVILVTAGDFLTMFIGWELVGLCSFFLIGHWYFKEGEEGEKCIKAGMKAFIFTRFGDIGFLAAIAVLYAKYGTLVFSDLVNAHYDVETLTILGLLFVLAAFGKSAQIPFMPWLSSPDNIDIDAMQGPTTVSALIHAATMVKAGIYLISRVFLIFPLGLSILFGDWSIIVIIAGFTAIIAGLSAIVSMDIKRILAYSTVSQLSYMFLVIGLAFTVQNNHELAISAFYTTQLHLMSHAFFKSLLFLCAGYIIHTYHSRNLADLGGVANWTKEKALTISFLIGSLALIGIPPMNGFFSKDAIVEVTYDVAFSEGLLIGKIAFLFTILAAIITTLYTAKLIYYLVFKEKSKINELSNAHDNHDFSHKSVFMPAVILIIATLTVVSSAFSFEVSNFFSDILPKQVFEIISVNNLTLPTITLTIIVFTLIISIWFMKRQPMLLDKVSKIIGIDYLLTMSRNGFYFDKITLGSWKIFQTGSNRLKFLHTGDLNYTVLFMSCFSFLIVIFFLVGGI